MVKFKKLKKVGRKVQMTMIAGLLVVAAFPFVGSSKVQTALADTPTMNPGGTPDYYTTPNYANSQLPEIDPVTKQVIPGTGIRKFVDGLPGLGADHANNLAQYIPVAVPDKTTYPGSDYYEISLVEYTEQMHSDLKPTKLRGYVQTNTTDPTVSKPSYLGPMIIADKNRPVRVKFTNKLPTGQGGDLFLPVDESFMGAGEGPQGGKYTQNRGLLHLHGGITPWISDGTPHQWITPAGENTPYPKGVSVHNVPDMPDPGDGSMTYFYTNQQSARMLFYHDHSYGITRLNVYAGEEAAYLLRDDVEKSLIASGVLPQEEIPLMIQDKTFVPTESQLAATDPTWDLNKWGKQGSLWFPHVYMQNQNPYDLSGANPMGRWDYGPWFWPPNTGLKNGPVPNPLAGQTGQAPMNPGVPNVSAVPEAFMDTPVINGTAYPTLTVDPKAYRFRILNAANDRMWNLQLYKAASNADMWNKDGSLNDANAGEVKMVDAVKKAGYPDTWPSDGRDGGVPDPDPAFAGPKMIQIGNDSGFLPKAVELQNQPIDYEYRRRSITVLNVSSKTLLLGPAERADVVVDFSKYAGQTLILYNDSPAPVPAFDPRYDYYTGDPDQSATGENTGGSPSTLPGYGPNTRTIMQIKVAPATANTVDTTQKTLDTLTTEIPKAFTSSQNPLLVPDGRWGNIQDTSLDISPAKNGSLTLPMEPKAIAEEFEQNYGRMNATLGVELPNTNYQNQTTVMLGYIDPSTENLTDSMTPMSPKAGDGTQIWKITHNGVDTHAIHFHLFDVQLVNRVGWDGSIRFPDQNEKGWKDTVRMNPLEDVIVALRPVSPKLPFGIPDSIRPLDPTMPLGSTMGFAGVDPTTGNPMAVSNKMTNFAWEYVWHCHLLGHEENDMMRTMVFNFTQSKPASSVLAATRVNGGPVNLTWTDPTPAIDSTTLGNPSNEVGYNIMRAIIKNGVAGSYTKVGIALANNTSFTDNSADVNTSYSYRVDAFNAVTAPDKTNPATVTDGGTPSNAVAVQGIPMAPTNLKITQSGQSASLTWTDNENNETGFVVERSTDGINFTSVATPGSSKDTGSVNFVDTTVKTGTYTYRVKTVNGTLVSGYSNTASITINNTPPPSPPAAPNNLIANLQAGPSVKLTWRDNALNETGFVIERSTNNGAYAVIATPTARNNTGNMSYDDTDVVADNTYSYRIKAVNGTSSSGYSNIAQVSVPKIPAAPTNLLVSAIAPRGSNTDTVTGFWSKPSGTVTGYVVQYATDAAFTQNVSTFNASSNTFLKSGFTKNRTYYFRVQAVNQSGSSNWSTVKSVNTP
ncbi:fibronectin type III domain-containing protein [Neobacillus sp. PS3-34]|uniref:fibronectin type III domain-containing protein n=1 Tax=Neobacillus sp. PS3-34 TaxID=3070678 RepID=UPI0027DF232A|nr:fibronectin type III domain-containing protein [Neobacillus sp. PS3-34]WML48070.1 fibronectin type III domain-containing protein [Neobacillus sp. PS3-34]